MKFIEPEFQKDKETIKDYEKKLYRDSKRIHN